MPRWILLLASLSGLLAGCANPAAGSPPTPYPPDYLPTVVALTGQAIAVAETATALAAPPTETPTPPPPTETPIPPTPLPTVTATLPPASPLMQMRIEAPGPMSKVVSPLELRMNVIAGESDLVQISLYGEDGRLLYNKLEKVLRRLSGIYVTLKMPFEVRAAAEVGRLTISTKDKQGRIQSLASVHVLLLSVGSDETTPPPDPTERFVVYKPLDRDSVSGGTLIVDGKIWPFNNQPVILELVKADGSVAGLRVLTFDSLDPQPFTTTIPYKVSEPTAVRLIVRQDDDRIAGLFYLYSQEVLLNP